MNRIAIFVDTGYLCMAGAAALNHPETQRRQIRIEIDKVVAHLKAHVSKISNAELLRVYWYDSCPGGARKTAEQTCIGHHQNVKLRLGTINKSGQQKGVDTMLVLDLFELAVHDKISDAIILSGDEDIRPGIERAQAYGTRVHLLGIKCPQENNQSYDLVSEADTVDFWEADIIKTFMTILEEPDDGVEQEQDIEDNIKALLIKAAQESAAHIHLPDIVAYKAQNGRGMPADIDGRLLARARGEINRDLNLPEKRFLRNQHRGLVEGMLDETVEENS